MSTHNKLILGCIGGLSLVASAVLFFFTVLFQEYESLAGASTVSWDASGNQLDMAYMAPKLLYFIPTSLFFAGLVLIILALRRSNSAR